ncbi:MAG: carboxypeptidase regulatory-like domain-containing protein [Dehalococcoidia bacterium]|nr:MAG: carboxypeptidase regulatory-like domain-containing protein [Dehalococcoidia bacterium]UCG84676.1 MAG: carboxypeptidase regulatory-like domain-containing protein [Dehalococcoidia bacterium]
MQVHAHGAKIEYVVDMMVEIVAMYESGEPMSGAQVVVYAPDDISTPWLTGICDDEGRYSFKPDTSMAGTYDVQVRQAGHGDIVHIPVGDGGTASGSSGGYGVGQIALMSVCVVWGFIGTGLYFLRRKA